MIEVEHLTKKYGDFAAVEDVSLEVRPGEVYGFLGPNGAGKTTTIRVMVGLSLPTTGTARIGGIDVVAEPSRAKGMIGYVPDRPFLYEKLTGWELLRFVSDLHRRNWAESEPRARALLQYLELEPWAPARIENYSHGMKQKLVLISAMAHDPQVLIIDEPMVGLDALAQKQVKTLLRTKAAEGKTVFLTTHTLSVAEAVCDRIAILRQGKIAATGTVAELKRLAGEKSGALEDAFLAITYGEE